MVTEDKGLGFASQKETENLEEGKGGILPYPPLALGLPDHSSQQVLRPHQTRTVKLVGLFGDSFTVGETPLRWRGGYFPFGLETETKPCNPLSGVFFSLFPAFYFFGGLFAICDLLGWGLTGFLHPGTCSIHPSGALPLQAWPHCL